MFLGYLHSTSGPLTCWFMLMWSGSMALSLVALCSYMRLTIHLSMSPLFSCWFEVLLLYLLRRPVPLLDRLKHLLWPVHLQWGIKNNTCGLRPSLSHVAILTTAHKQSLFLLSQVFHVHTFCSQNPAAKPPKNLFVLEGDTSWEFCHTTSLSHTCG